MSESVWWSEEAWWEKKSLPLGFITLSFRQLVTLAVSFLVAYAVSLPFQFPIAGVTFGGRAAAFCFVLGVGYIISSRRVKLIPLELQALYVLRTKASERLGRIRRSKPSMQEVHQLIPVHEIVVDDFKNPVPLVISEGVKGLEKETRMLLLFDGQSRGDDLVSPQKPRFRLTYLPLPADLGTHQVDVKLEGSSSSILSLSLSVRANSP